MDRTGTEVEIQPLPEVKSCEAGHSEAKPSEVGRRSGAELPWWFSGGFGRLFAGQAVSVVGSQVTFLAVPIAAVFLLGATPAAMGLLGALDNLPYLLFGLGVGVVVDRFRRRRLMVLGDLVRAATVGSIPLAWAMGVLSFGQLCVVVFVVGICNLVFDVSSQAQMPDLLPAERLVGGNAALQTTTSLATVVGPGLAGQLIGFVGAPVAIVVDAVSYVVSACFIRSIREPESVRPSTDESARSQIVEGLRFVRSDGRLVAIAGGASTMSFAANALLAVFVYYLATRLGMDAASIGTLYMGVGIAGATGAILVPAAAGRVGLGRTMAVLPVIAGLGLLPLPFVVESGVGGLAQGAALVGGALVFGFGMISFSVLAAGLRQTLAPEAARGRVLGTLRFLEWGSMPIGSGVGGAIGQVFGPAAAVEFAGLAFVSGALWILISPLIKMREPVEA